MNEDVAVGGLARDEAITAFVVVPFDQRGDVLAHRDAVGHWRRLWRRRYRRRRIDVEHLHDLPAFGAAHAGASHCRTGLEIFMPGLAQCRYMQERVAVIGVEG